jgi:hypothetical protein
MGGGAVQRDKYPDYFLLLILVSNFDFYVQLHYILSLIFPCAIFLFP